MLFNLDYELIDFSIFLLFFEIKKFILLFSIIDDNELCKKNDRDDMIMIIGLLMYFIMMMLKFLMIKLEMLIMLIILISLLVIIINYLRIKEIELIISNN